MNATTRQTLMSSAAHDWRTPLELFATLDAEFGFALDAAADDENRLCPRWYTEADDALRQPWDAVTWCNPPYGRALPAFVRRAFAEVESSRCPLAVLLIPARTDTAVWHECVMRATAIRLIRGRLRFGLPDGTATDPAPFPSAIVLFERHYLGMREFSSCDTSGRVCR